MNKEEKQAYFKAYYKAHKEEAKIKSAESYYANHEENKEKLRKYYKKNKDVINAKNNVYYHAHKEEYAPKRKIYAALHKNEAKGYQLKRYYGISLQEYDDMFTSQNGQCAICKEKDTLVVDHNHETGKVRELLCKKCNLALGHSKESVTILDKMIEYLKRH